MDTVCHIITKLELGGAQQNTLFTVVHLDRTQFRPILITGESGLLDAEARVMEGVEFHQIPSLVRTINPMADLRALAALTALLKKLRPTIVHTHSSKAGIIGRLAAWMAGAPIIIHSIHGFGFTRYQPRLHRHVLLAAERVASRVTTRFFAVSEANRSQGMAMKLFSADQCRVIRSGVDLAAIRRICVDVKAKKRELGVDPEQPLVGMVAPMKPQKAPVDFIKMATAIHEKNPAVRFIFVGDGELRPAVEAEIKRCGLSELIRLLGWRRDVAEILRCFDVFVLTSLWEGLPRTYLEALASGVPVVGTRVNGAEEVIHNGVNGYLVEPGDVTRLAQRVLAVLEDPDQGRRMGHQGAARLTQEFDIWEMVRQQEHEYAHLIASLKFRRGSVPGTNTNAAGVESRQIPIAKKAKYW